LPIAAGSERYTHSRLAADRSKMDNMGRCDPGGRQFIRLSGR